MFPESIIEKKLIQRKKLKQQRICFSNESNDCTRQDKVNIRTTEDINMTFTLLRLESKQILLKNSREYLKKINHWILQFQTARVFFIVPAHTAYV